MLTTGCSSNAPADRRDACPTTAFIALGSNLGDSRHIIEQAFICLQELSAAPIRRSSLWSSAPVNCPPGSPDFINAVAAITPFRDETPESLLTKLRALEIQFGRAPKLVLNEARPLDLDLIAFGEEVRTTPELTLPHPRSYQRAFVLLPLAEIAPDFILPGTTETVAELARRLEPASACQRL